MINKCRSESGSYTIEACVSLLFFLIAVMFIYSQIKALIAESIVQNAVNSMAKETASYVYVLDRAGVIVNNSAYNTAASDSLYENVNNAMDGFTGLMSDMYTDNGSGGKSININGIEGDATSMIDSLKNIYSIASNTSKEEFVSNAKALAVGSGEGITKMLGNELMSYYYRWKLNAYLPMDYSVFCSYFLIDGEISFSNSRVFPSQANNSILVVAEYDTSDPFKAFPRKRHVAKYAFTAAWVSSNTNK